MRFEYDSIARRLSKTVEPPRNGASPLPASHTRFVWDGDVLAHEIRSAADHNGDPITEERTYLYEDGSFQPSAHKEAGRWVHYVNDQVGTPERLLDDDGTLAGEVQRSAWGTTQLAAGSRARTAIRFQGQYADDETGLSYNRWRYYEAETSHFVASDP